MLTPQAIFDLYPSLDERLRLDMGRDAVFDLYLAFLSERNTWDRAGLVLKGGTAVRKFHCSPDTYRRISYDLDFSLTRALDDRTLVDLMSSADTSSPMGFSLTLSSHNRLALRAPFLPEPLSVPCDVNRSLPVQAPAVIPMRYRPVHDHFDMDMSFRVPVMTVEETAAEKLSRWQVRPLVRDLYDLSMLRPLITDPGAVARLYTIKGHRSFHNPNKDRLQQRRSRSIWSTSSIRRISTKWSWGSSSSTFQCRLRTSGTWSLPCSSSSRTHTDSVSTRCTTS